MSHFNASGTDGNVAVHFKDLPCLSCGHPEHSKQYVTPEFGSHLMDSLYFAGTTQFPGSRLKRLGRRQHCYSCGKRMAAGPSRAGEVSGLVMVKGAPQFTLRISGPILKCEFCGREQLHNTEEASFHSNEAIVAAFKQIMLEP